MGNKGKVKGPF